MTNDLTAYEPRDIGELRQFAQEVTATGLVPTAYRNKPADAMVAAMYGKEVAGLGPLISLNFVAVVNGRPAFYSDAVPGIAFNKKLITDMEESFEGKPYEDDFTAVCVVTRPNGTKVTQRFSVADAKKASLWGKSGTWQQYPKRMLQWRARGWAIRDAAPHMMFGPTVEELHDVEEHRGPENAKVINPETRRAQPLAQPELVELYDADGVEYLLAPGEVEQWIKDAIAGATAEELQALSENNPVTRAFSEAIKDEANRRMSAMAARNAPPPRTANLDIKCAVFGCGSQAVPGTTTCDAHQKFSEQPIPQTAPGRPQDAPQAQAEPPANPKTVKQRAQEIAEAFKGAPDIDELLKLEERLREDIARLPDVAKSRLAAIFHEKREAFENPAPHAGEPPLEHPMAELDHLEDEGFRNAAEKERLETQFNLLKQ